MNEINIISGVVKEPLIQTYYGTAKVGKTTFAAAAPKPILFACEKGANNIQVDKYPVKTVADFIKGIEFLLSGKHDFETIIVDSVDALERICAKQVCDDLNVGSLSEVGYGAAYKAVDEKVFELIEGVELLRDTANMQVIFICHAKVSSFNNPLGDNYSVYEIDCRDKVVGKLRYISDCILFANIEKEVKESSEGLRVSKKVDSNANNRTLYCVNSGGAECGNRIGLPRKVPLDGAKFWQWIFNNYYNNESKES